MDMFFSIKKQLQSYFILIVIKLHLNNAPKIHFKFRVEEQLKHLKNNDNLG